MDDNTTPAQRPQAEWDPDPVVTDGPYSFTVDGRTYTGTFAGRYFDADGNELPHEVGARLFDASTEEDDALPDRARRLLTSGVPAEQVFSVSGSTATRARRAQMADADLLERQLQRWVKQHPAILGEDLLIVTEEFDRWTTASGDSTAERLDILALDREGRLVVAELKRHRAPDAVLVQALNYAAMASRFTLDLLAEVHAQFLNRPDQEPSTKVTAEEALEELLRWAPSLSDDTLAPCRIVLVAEDYTPVLTNTCIFLLESGLDLRVMRVGLHAMPGHIYAMTATQVLPVPRASDFMVRPVSHPGRPTGGRGNPRTDRLVNVIADGTPLRIVVPRVDEDRDAIEAWLQDVPSRASASWQNDARRPIRWVADDSTWAMRDLIRHIVAEATGAPPRTGIWGPNWLTVPDGRTIARVDREARRESEGRS